MANFLAIYPKVSLLLSLYVRGMKKILTTRLSVCSLGVSCNDSTPMVPNECNSLNSRSKEKTMTDRWRAAIADQAE